MHFFTHKNIGQPPDSDGFRDYRKRTVARNGLSTVTQQFKKVEYGFKEVSEKPKNNDIITQPNYRESFICRAYELKIINN